jgi:hypothetical protein
MTAISTILTVLKHAWQELTLAGILRIPFPRFVRISERRENSRVA